MRHSSVDKWVLSMYRIDIFVRYWIKMVTHSSILKPTIFVTWVLKKQTRRQREGGDATFQQRSSVLDRQNKTTMTSPLPAEVSSWQITSSALWNTKPFESIANCWFCSFSSKPKLQQVANGSKGF